MKSQGVRYKFIYFGIVTALLVMLGATTENAYAAKPKIPKNKAGATHHTHSAGTNQGFTEQGTSNTGTITDNMVGFAVFYERLFLDRFSAGFKYGYGLERNSQITVGTNNLEVLETASFWALEFRAYFEDHLRPGIKPFLGVGYGNYTATSTIKVIPTSGSVTEDETTATIPFTSLSAGADYTFGFGGVRLELGQSTGKRSDLESSSTYYATYDYTASIVGISVYSFF